MGATILDEDWSFYIVRDLVQDPRNRFWCVMPSYEEPFRRRRGEGEEMTAASERRLVEGEELLIEAERGREHERRIPADIRGDESNIALLLGLYLLQGIPLGLSAAIPMILQNKGASFKQQAEFSFAGWPFSVKLLWAPLVDSIYWKRFGRRKSWLVPSQYLIGTAMILLSSNIDEWMGNSETKTEPQVFMLTLVFFAMNFLAATQDIAVDGWALTMLKRRNKGYASTCNSVGQTAGFFLGFVVFIALESATFCNSYLRSTPEPTGMVTASGFVRFWGWTYLALTSFVAIFKKETDSGETEASSFRSAVSSYQLLLKIFKLRNITVLSILLLTAKVGFAATDGLTSLKLIQQGVPKDKLAILAVPLVPLQIVLPLFIARYNLPHQPMNLYLTVFPYRLAYNFVAAFFVYVTPSIMQDNEIPSYYYYLLLSILALHTVTMVAMFVQVMAFFAHISDPAAGGTYMTLLNTLSNMGGTWSSTAAIWLVDGLTFKSCSLDSNNDCSSPALVESCEAAQGLVGKCQTTVDGFYIETLLCTVLGYLWFRWGSKSIRKLQSMPVSSWSIERRR